MRVSAVGFLFQEKIKSSGLKGKNYTCIIHKVNPEGNFNRNVITSPVIKSNTLVEVTPEVAQADVLSSLISISAKKNPSKFIGATIKDGIKETEIHSILSDKLFAVRTCDEFGRNKFRVLGKNSVQNLLSKNLYVSI